jgi:glycine dehydrogenase subunit 1
MTNEFSHSYLPHGSRDRHAMLDRLGAAGVEDLFTAIPQELRDPAIALPEPLTEPEVCEEVKAFADRNRTWGGRSFTGAGCYRHHVPAAVRVLTGRGEFATAYTPYQAEVSQGTLQHIFEFQTAVCALTGLDVANASLWDGPSAAAEGAFLALRHTKREQFAYSSGLHPETIEVLETYAGGPGFATAALPLDARTGRTPAPQAEELSACGALLVQQPNFLGVIEDLRPLAETAHAAGALLVVSHDPLTLGLLADPGSLGADVVVGDVQAFGNAMSFGGPSAGYMACRDTYLRQLPGRLVGRTIDADGRTCYTLTLQAREQHIRRAKATSNICSNQALCALAATVYLALLGPRGLRRLGELCVARSHRLAALLTDLPGVTLLCDAPYFNEFALRLPLPASDFARAMKSRGIDPGVPLSRFGEAFPADVLLVAVTELNSPPLLAEYVEAAREALKVDEGSATRRGPS